MSKLNLNPMADWGYVNNSRFRFLSIRNQGGGVEPVPPVPPEPTNRILYTVVEGGYKPASTWITEHCSDNVFDESTGKGYLVLNEDVTAIECPPSGQDYPNMFDDSGEDSNIATVVIPSQITSIGEDAFAVYKGLTSVTIPDSVIKIEQYAFYQCSSLTSITIPDSVAFIGDIAFNLCSNLTSVTCLAKNKPYLGANNFTASNDTLYVPAESVQTYLDDTNWNVAFGGNIQAIQE